ncbi:MAG: homocysteine biosynthesis protein [Dehalococcoidia bacterium]|nr:homocysteine biosynthesis protein [Dehalococcoidia bacterium]
MAKTIAEINEKIKKGQAVVVTAEEVISIAKKKGVAKAAKEIDVVTTGTFGPMCSSSVYMNLGHSSPRIKVGGGKVTLNDVPAYTGVAAVDIILGATAMPEDDPKNRIYPGEFGYGGGHVIEELVSGKDIRLIASAYGTDCYPRKKIETLINIKTVNEAMLFNMRNAYQNYSVAVNIGNRMLYTYMGVLKPRLGNANFCSAGQLSPLMNDPFYRTIGIGTRIFLGGGMGYIAWNGTQHNPCAPRTEKGVPTRGAATLAVIGDLKQMSPKWLVGTSFLGYGATLTVGIGVPIPILDEEMLKYTLVTDADILAPVIDFSDAYPNRKPEVLAEVSYAELKSGNIVVKGRQVPTASLSSYPGAVTIAKTLKDWIKKGSFLLAEPVAPLPGPQSGIKLKTFEEQPLP